MENTNLIERIDDRERKLELIVERLNIIIEQHDKDIKDSNKRIASLENSKSKSYEKLIWLFIASALGAITSFIFDWFSFKEGF